MGKNFSHGLSPELQLLHNSVLWQRAGLKAICISFVFCMSVNTPTYCECWILVRPRSKVWNWKIQHLFCPPFISTVHCYYVSVCHCVLKLAPLSLPMLIMCNVTAVIKSSNVLLVSLSLSLPLALSLSLSKWISVLEAGCCTQVLAAMLDNS